MEKIINIKILENKTIRLESNFFGVKGEKNITKLKFEWPEQLKEYNKEILIEMSGNVFSDVIVNDEYIIDNNITTNSIIKIAVQATNIEGTKVFKTLYEKVIFGDSLDSTDCVPEPAQVSEFNTMINTLNKSIEKVEKLEENVSNINIESIKENNVTTITITKSDGTQESFDILDGEDYIITEEDYIKIEEQVKTDLAPTINEIKEISEHAEIIARGRATGYVFDTIDDLDIWLQNSENVSKLVLGDNFYIRATNVPDYWWDGEQKQQLEAEKPDLSNLVDKSAFEYDEETETLSITI